jgi:hypothetical protein
LFVFTYLTKVVTKLNYKPVSSGTLDQSLDSLLITNMAGFWELSRLTFQKWSVLPCQYLPNKACKHFEL